MIFDFYCLFQEKGRQVNKGKSPTFVFETQARQMILSRGLWICYHFLMFSGQKTSYISHLDHKPIGCEQMQNKYYHGLLWVSWYILWLFNVAVENHNSL